MTIPDVRSLGESNVPGPSSATATIKGECSSGYAWVGCLRPPALPLLHLDPNQAGRHPASKDSRSC